MFQYKRQLFLTNRDILKHLQFCNSLLELLEEVGFLENPILVINQFSITTQWQAKSNKPNCQGVRLKPLEQLLNLRGIFPSGNFFYLYQTRLLRSTSNFFQVATTYQGMSLLKHMINKFVSVLNFKKVQMMILSLCKWDSATLAPRCKEMSSQESPTALD